MAKTPKTKVGGKSVENIRHGDARRKNIPTAEYQPVLQDKELTPIRVAYERRNKELDPQLVWRGKEAQDAGDLVVQAPPLYICVLRTMSITDSGPSRSLIPGQADHLFRTKPITDSDHADHPLGG